MQIESSDTSLISNAEMIDVKNAADKDITATDIMLLCDLFYLPFEHGSKALQLLTEFHWLKTNAVVLCKQRKRKTSSSSCSNQSSCGNPEDCNHLNGTTSASSNTAQSNDQLLDSCNKSEVQEWLRRSQSFENLCLNIFQLARKIARCPNKELCYDLFSYVWDIVAVLSLLSAYVKWLSLGHFPANINSHTQGGYTWFSKGWKETFMSGDQEPWVFRGGLVADLQRLIPLDAGNDLFIYKLPETSTVNLYTFRPYRYTDETTLYSVCYRTMKDGEDFVERQPESLRNLLADRWLGPFLTLAPQYCIVIEDSSGEIVGYACAAIDTRVFIRNQEQCWIPEMCLKYPLSLLNEVNPAGNETPKQPTNPMQLAAHDSIMYFHNFNDEYPVNVCNSHPSVMCCRILKPHLTEDETISKRLITVLLAALRTNGSSFGVHVYIAKDDHFMYQLYSKLGFVEIFRDEFEPNLYMGRNF